MLMLIYNGISSLNKTVKRSLYNNRRLKPIKENSCTFISATKTNIRFHNALSVALRYLPHAALRRRSRRFQRNTSTFENPDPVAVIPDGDLCVGAAFTYGRPQSSSFSKLTGFLSTVYKGRVK